MKSLNSLIHCAILMAADTAVGSPISTPEAVAEATKMEQTSGTGYAPPAPKKVKMQNLPIEEVFPLIKYTDNVRAPEKTHDDYTRETAGLEAEVYSDGRITHPLLVHFKEVDGKLVFDQVIRGYRRATVVYNLHVKYPNDRRWDTIPVEVQSGLTAEQIENLKMDTGNQKPLERHEVVYAIWRHLTANPKTSRDQISLKFNGYFEMYWPMGGKPESRTNDRIIKHRTGNTQNIMMAFRLPDAARQYYYDVIKEGGPISWRKKELAELVTIFEEERAKDLSGAVNKATPGPLAAKKWAEILDAEDRKAQDADGTDNGPLTTAAMSKKEMGIVVNNSPSTLIKVIVRAAMREFGPQSDAILDYLGLLLQRDVESKFTDADRENIKAIVEGNFEKAGFKKEPAAAAA